MSFLTDRGVFSKGDIDFGSRLLAETFQLPEIDGSILDVGCGYGPLGITISKAFPNREVTMIDINERAVGLAKNNAERNDAKVTVVQSDLFENVSGNYAAVITNPPIRAGKQIVHNVFSGAYSLLSDEGELWVVIQKKQGAPSALEALGEQFGEVETVVKKKGYYIIKAKKV
ncbi:16S rRNA m(2)G 1207 methyltransferase [Scopulibacillus darangshiensis]|uniref:16S rRNA m(2)G 1207 methyltransferase n=1 Tax=Scopulibacillus darangshiensis TaxID=442528 RepID=A0A4R2NQL8_9BACL|nr:16S rRNA m(2)G 1207 methyltransferase [Scopulibacillus darangshiensis]